MPDVDFDEEFGGVVDRQEEGKSFDSATKEAP